MILKKRPKKKIKVISGLDDRQRALFGNALYKLRVSKGWPNSQQFGEAGGLSRSAIIAVERGQNTPTWAMLRHYSTILEMPIHTIVECWEDRQFLDGIVAENDPK